jgi:hypothetical protein
MHIENDFLLELLVNTQALIMMRRKNECKHLIVMPGKKEKLKEKLLLRCFEFKCVLIEKKILQSTRVLLKAF